MTTLTLTPEQRRLSAEFEASLRDGTFHNDSYGDEGPFWMVAPKGGYSQPALDPTTPAGQIAAMELLQLSVDWAWEIGEWRASHDDINEVGEVYTNSPGAAICAAWLAAAERHKHKTGKE